MVQSIFFFHVLLPMGYLIRNRLTMIRVYERHRDKLKIYVDELMAERPTDQTIFDFC